MMIWSDMTLINRYQVVKSDTELFAAAIFGSRIYIAFDDQEAGSKYVVAHSGPVEKYTPEYVRIAGVYYRRSQYEFRVHIK
ncbi:hypothetical protein P4H66_19345 [Paenibacillus dokdonensis]|uniref:KTSC domain-containing protein n=1 Tax=Paenibacillus dokdonensis TaxID=2567944 RepID=A0ABU6GUF4_9BACL|nr:hypothetical protein [Paenibacillus dokdonensis]MEC0241961.1 hypothetical protein [Paenibacillus dokdonensis]